MPLPCTTTFFGQAFPSGDSNNFPWEFIFEHLGGGTYEPGAYLDQDLRQGINVLDLVLPNLSLLSSRLLLFNDFLLNASGRKDKGRQILGSLVVVGACSGGL